MAANTSPIYLLTPKAVEVAFVNADGTTPKDLISAATDGTKIQQMVATSDDTAARDLQVFIHDGTTAYGVGTVPVPALAGTDGLVAAVNLLDKAWLPWLDSKGEFLIPTGYKVQVAPLVAVTATKTIEIVCLGMDY